MDGSILATIRDLLLIKDNIAFDQMLVTYINGVFMQLNQLGVGPEKSFHITGADEKWSDFMGEDILDYQALQTYVYLKVKILFDPPSSSFVLEAMNNECQQYEWRLFMRAERKEANDEQS